MTIKEFKEKYPQYKNIKNDELWNKLEELLLNSDNVLIADYTQEKVYYEPLILSGVKVKTEDSSTTRWLDKEDNLVRVGEPEKTTERYKIGIINLNKNENI